MRFDPEVFISYAHIDDQAAWGGVPWVSKFHEALDARIEQLRGERVDVFFDPSLQGNEVLTEALVDRLKEAGVFVPVLTPRYIKSEWTRRELAEFNSWAARNGGVCIGDKSRIFIVVKTAIPRTEYPPELKDLIEYKFFTVEEGTDTPRELEIGPLFYKKIDDVARHMKSLLDAMEGLDGATAPRDKNVKTIYLAETTLDIQSQYEALRRDLEQAGQRILPSRPLPIVSDKLEEFVREQMAQSDVSVHLFGSTYSFVPEGCKECVAAIQNRLAMERAAAGGFSHLIWIAPGVKAEDERQSMLLDSLRANPQLQKGSDLLECPLEDLKTLIHTRVERPAQPSVAAAADGAPRQIYLIYGRDDREAVTPWCDFLFNQGLEVLCPAFDGEEADIRQLHEENLRTADAVAIFYGAGKDTWIQATLRGLQRRKAEENARQLRAVAILTAPPETPEKRRFKTHFCLVIPQMEGFAPEPIAPFLKLVNGG
jgi:TIR domain